MRTWRRPEVEWRASADRKFCTAVAPRTKSSPCLLRMRAAPVMLARAILRVHDGRFGDCNGGVLHVVPLSAAVYGNGHRAAWILRLIGETLPASGRAARSSCLWRPRFEPRPLPHCVGAQLLGRRALRAPAHRRRAVPRRRGAAPWPAGAPLGTCTRAGAPRVGFRQGLNIARQGAPRE